MDLAFTKLHGNGNDFVLIDEYENPGIPDDMKADFAALYCDRRYGIGCDGVLFLSRSQCADISMRLLQPDGSEADMCGNGIRCLARYAFETGYIKETCTVETPAGVIHVRTRTSDEEFFASVRMPAPVFSRPGIPATGEGEFHEKIGDWDVYAVNTGVPHAVIFVENIDSIPVQSISPPIRHHASFPEGANVNFVERSGENRLRIRTYERGVEDETLSCGTGATAAAAVAYHTGMTGNRVDVETRGGGLTITLSPETLMEGPAVLVFTGLITF